MRTSELGRFRSAVAVTGGVAAIVFSAICFPQARAAVFLAGLALALFLLVAVLPIVAMALILRAIGRDPASTPRLASHAGGLRSDRRAPPLAFPLRSVPGPAWTGRRKAS
jgi:hypothetical protein